MGSNPDTPLYGGAGPIRLTPSGSVRDGGEEMVDDGTNDARAVVTVFTNTALRGSSLYDASGINHCCPSHPRRIEIFPAEDVSNIVVNVSWLPSRSTGVERILQPGPKVPGKEKSGGRDGDIIVLYLAVMTGRVPDG